MTLAEAVSLPDRFAINLLMSYRDRKMFEAKTIWAALGEGLSGSQSRGQASLTALKMMGFGIRA